MAEAGATKAKETASANLQELQETVSRLSSHTGVEAVLILNRDGDIIAESTKAQENMSSTDAATMVSKLLKLATSYVQSLSAEDEVSFLQMRTENGRELYIAPHEGYVLALARR
uniref:Roadblock/LAMTOR2 domain-containing protein n=1 Tax=Entomoneis paludosa TaxID=265537 RepID=A0A7S2VEM1_9STRA|mmetsp:Transcript_19488/g.40353  ORF Transcript_19488/g.40353 Transcript_19488/m.40353 type:complete len:114 (+) Transcript_19488:67-408(+)